LIGAAALSLGLALPGLGGAADPVKPELGAGPHRDRTPQTSGEGERPRQPVPAVPAPKADPGGASTGPSVNPAGRPSPEDETSAREREEDERKATQSKEKMKKRPGYKDDAPLPRASRV
jgi:hypothetical protein